MLKWAKKLNDLKLPRNVTFLCGEMYTNSNSVFDLKRFFTEPKFVNIYEAKESIPGLLKNVYKVELW
jgi:hypothetical protein